MLMPLGSMVTWHCLNLSGNPLPIISSFAFFGLLTDSTSSNRLLFFETTWSPSGTVTSALQAIPSQPHPHKREEVWLPAIYPLQIRMESRIEAKRCALRISPPTLVLLYFDHSSGEFMTVGTQACVCLLHQANYFFVWYLLAVGHRCQLQMYMQS